MNIFYEHHIQTEKKQWSSLYPNLAEEQLC